MNFVARFEKRSIIFALIRVTSRYKGATIKVKRISRPARTAGNELARGSEAGQKITDAGRRHGDRIIRARLAGSLMDRCHVSRAARIDRARRALSRPCFCPPARGREPAGTLVKANPARDDASG